MTAAAQNLTLTSDTDIILMTGIARSQPLYEHLQTNYHISKHIKYPDHHRYTIFEIEQLKKYFGENSVLFTTEKDWMRLQGESFKKTLSLLPVFILPIEIEFLTEEEHQTFIHILQDHVRRTQKKN